ncbi:MAG: potassium channel family protein [Candidatus Dormibacteraceae bacterium]
MKVVIVGCGRIGSRLAAQLAQDKHDVTIIDRNPNAFLMAQNRGVLPPDFSGTQLVGDGTDTDVLRRVGVEGAQWFAALTEGDNRNIMAAQIAKVVFKVPTVVCRIADPIREEAYRKIGLQVFCPTILGVQVVKSLLGEEED